MYSSCDDEGNQYLLMESFVDYWKNDKAMSVADQMSVLRGRKVMRNCTAGWQICVQWKDGLTSWQYLKDLNESKPVQTSEYDAAKGIYNEPGFNWWVDAVMRKREIILSLIKNRNAWYLKKTHKFG